MKKLVVILIIVSFILTSCYQLKPIPSKNVLNSISNISVDTEYYYVIKKHDSVNLYYSTTPLSEKMWKELQKQISGDTAFVFKKFKK
jgi:hypothetical protein